jgi:hypothetical protein
LQIARKEAGADESRTDTFLIIGMGFELNNFKPANFSGTSEKIQVAGTAGTEPEIISYYNDTRLYIEVEKTIQELIRGLTSEFSGKGNDQQMINSESAEHFRLFFEAGEQFEIRTGFSQYYSRMRPECDNESLRTGSCSKVLNPGKQILMATVDAIKNPNGNRRPV